MAKALLCLTDARRKQEYDSSLGRTGEVNIKRRTLEEILTAQNAITPDQLAKGHKFAQAAGMELRDALIQTKAAPADVVMSAYAESVGVPYVDVADVKLDESLVSQVPAVLARQNSCAPMMVDDNQLLMVSPHLIDPNVEEELRLRLGMPVRSVLCTPAGINELINKYYPREKAAAEVAAGGTKQSGKTVGAAKAAQADAKSGAKQRLPEVQPPRPRPHRRRLKKPRRNTSRSARDYTLVAFNFTFMAYEVIYTSSGFFPDWSWLGVFGGFFVAGGAAFYTWTKMK